jgi:hypothetical protein
MVYWVVAVLVAMATFIFFLFFGRVQGGNKFFKNMEKPGV